MGGVPSKGTPKDRRLGRNKSKPAAPFGGKKAPPFGKKGK
jgi:hypothetical protein